MKKHALAVSAIVLAMVGFSGLASAEPDVLYGMTRTDITRLFGHPDKVVTFGNSPDVRLEYAKRDGDGMLAIDIGPDGTVTGISTDRQWDE